jgi:hypothetical protein
MARAKAFFRLAFVQSQLHPLAEFRALKALQRE